MDLTNWKVKVAELNQYAEGLSATHFDGPNMLKSSKEVAEKFSGLDEPCLKRRIKLNESLKFHQFEFDVNAEIHWFQDREQVISSADVAQDLVEAQNLIKKHQKLSREVAGHQSQIEKTVAGGEILVTQDHFAKGAIAFKSKELTDKWKALKEMVLEKRKRLEQSLKIQTFLSEVNEVESWIGDKVNFFKNSDYGKNEDAAVKLLTKHKADELEVDTYFGLVNEMKMAAHKLASSKPPEEAVITDRTKELEMHLKELEQLLVQRKAKIIDSKHFHEYIRETDNFLNWIAEKMQTATSDDYGSDYEHLLLLQSKFRDFKHHIESNADRFGQSEQFAGKLKKTDLAQEVKLRQSEVKEAWENLLDVIAARNKKLNAAGEIHRFNRDVAEALCRIQEKYSILSTEDLGRDLHSVQSLLRKHEGYENDLVALEAQLQSLIDDSARLQSAYPGGNADHILQQQEIVVQHWNTLQERAALRKDHLLASFALQKFIAVVKDLERWADTLGTEIGTQERVRDAASAQALKTEHDRIKAEIETREPDFNAVVKSGEAMINEDHIAGEEIRSHMTRMLQCREALHTAWQLKKVYLDQLNDLHCFLRDAKQLDQLSNQQEHFLTSTELGSTVEQVLSNIKKQEAFEKLLSSQDEKLISLQQSGIKLLQQNHFDSETIRKRMDEITSRRARVKEMSLVRKQDLDRAKQVLSYQRRADETVSWILEKDAGAHLDESSITEDLDAIQFMIRAHNSFERNLGAVREQVEILTKEAQRLISLFSEVRDEIEAKNNTVTEMWHSLLMKSARKRHRLEQAESWQAYYNEYKKLICWIKELFQAIVLEDLAIADVESAEIQLVRHKERKIELDNRTETCDQFRAVGEGLLSKGHMMAEEIKTKLDDFIRSLNELHTTWRNRKSVYEQNVDARKFQRDADMLDDWIEESLDTLNDKNLGDSISRAEELIKKHEEFERRILAQEDKFSALKRITLIENTFKRQQEAEEEMIRSEYARQEQEKRLLEEQSKEDERRRNADASKPNDGHGYGFVRSLIGSKHQKPQENGFKLPPVEIEGTLDRKQEHLSGGKRAPNRSWKVYYTVLCGQLLCFFKDKLAFMANVAAAPPVNILGAKCSKASDYTKKKHVFRLLLTDNSEFLFAANEEGIIQEWLNKMSFHANLPPSMQLTSYESAKEQLPNSSPTSQNSHPDQREHRGEVSSQTSSSPDITREHSKSELNLGGSKRPPPLPQALPPSVMSRSSVHIPVNGSASQNGARGPPPLPPPRTITMASEFPSHPIQQQVTLRGHENGSDRRPITEADLYEMQRQEINVSNGVNGRSASFRNTMPAARQVVHTNGSEYANEQVHVVRSSHSFIMPAAPPQYVPSAHVHGAPVRPVYDHPRHPASIRNIDQRFEMNSDEEWSEKRTEFRYAQTTTQQQVMVARHMSLPPNAPRPNQFVGQGMQTQAMGMRPQSAASSTSEDDIPVHKAVTKKKGVMSLFKRNK
ncbi:Spectrin alpha chain, non-erythrocytic 1 [Halotydeus destructor]|nr:Spectrin alpha chain, non-erythrocytic 1 [Halotydeus destructor]